MKTFYDNVKYDDEVGMAKRINVRVFENSNDCIGQVIVQGNNHEECEITLNSILKNIEMKLK